MQPSTTSDYREFFPLSRSSSATIEYAPAPRMRHLLQGSFARLEQVAADPTLWPEDAEAPSKSAIEQAYTVLQRLEEVGFAPSRVVASAEGGIAICFIVGEKYADVECLNTGEILGVTSNRHDRPIVWEVEPSAGGIAQAVARLRKFFPE